MGYSLKTLKEELTSKNLADYGLVAWGQKTSKLALFGGAIGGAIAGASSPMFVISLVKNSNIAVIPFSNKEIKYHEGKAYNKTKIQSAKVSGLFGKKLTIKIIGGETLTFPIMQGASAVKEILNKLGF